ncbi:MAG: ABC transporter permease subunit [Chloroflexota bacterium]
MTMHDVLTVTWKEQKERSARQGSWRGRIANLFFPLVMMGTLAVAPPVAVGQAWTESAFSLILSVLVPLMVVGMAIPDSFAGERERRTLRALLATRLPDRAILVGKMAGPVVEALLATAVLHLVSLAALNIAHWQGSIAIYALSVGLANAALAVLLALLSASLGVLISLRAASVQQAMQILMVASVSPLWLASIAVVFIGFVVPLEWREAFEQWFQTVVLTADFEQVMIVVIGTLAIVDLALVVAVVRRFRRSRLVAG